MLNPSGQCHCGCGEPAPLATGSDAVKGYVRGQPRRYINGHQRRLRIGWTPTPGPLPTPCWLWTGKPDAHGYGNYVRGLVSVKAHVLIYQLFEGPLPRGHVLDHLCRVRICVNPDHVEPVTHRENVLRGIGPTATNAAKTVCAHGHALSGTNLLLRADGNRDCRECMRRRSREYQRRVRGEIAADPKRHEAVKRDEAAAQRERRRRRAQGDKSG